MPLIAPVPQPARASLEADQQRWLATSSANGNEKAAESLRRLPLVISLWR